eukprot:3693344-Amphidinium_carterae.1
MFLDGDLVAGPDDAALCELGHHPSADRQLASAFDEQAVERLYQFTLGLHQSLRATYAIPHEA